MIPLPLGLYKINAVDAVSMTQEEIAIEKELEGYRKRGIYPEANLIDFNSPGGQMRELVHMVLLPFGAPSNSLGFKYKSVLVDPLAEAAYQHPMAARGVVGGMLGAIAYLIYKAVK